MSTGRDETLPEWDLTGIYRSAEDPAWKKDQETLRKKAAAFKEKYRGRVNSLSPQELYNALKESDSVSETAARLNLFAYLSFTLDTQSTVNQGLVSEVEELGSEVASELVFFDLELGKTDYSFLEKESENPENQNLKEYLYYIRKAADRAKHNLTEELESYGIEKNLTGRSALTGIFDELFGAFQFSLTTPEKGREIFTEETALAALHSPLRSYRTAVYSEFLNQVGKNSVVLNNIYNNLMLDHRLDWKRRGFSGPMEPRNLANQVSSRSVQAMMEAVESGFPAAQDYFRWKAQYLGIPDFTNADIYAPVGGSETSLDFKTASELVSEAYIRFDPGLKTELESFYSDKRVDASLRGTKRAGAFSYGASAGLDAYVMLNYTGDIRSVQTLAHELGHGLHHQLSRRSLNNSSIETPLTMAETASVFGEMLLNEMLLEKSSSEDEKLSILSSQMEGIIATVFRQTVLTRFEERAHAAREKGRVPGEELNSIWMQENSKLYGDSVKMVDAYQWGWAYIPHFIHTPFYCYAYSFGQLLVLSLYNEYRKQGRKFTEGYLNLLAAGGSDSPDRLILKHTGLDINKPDFWMGAIDMIRTTVARIKTLR